MEPYSIDLRTRVLAACDAGKGTSAVAKLFTVSPAWVRRLKQHRRERGGDVAPRTGGGARASRTKIDRGRLADLVKARPDATLVELRDRLGVDVTPWAVGLALRALGLTYKKKSVRAAEQDRPDVAAARAAWRVSQLGLDPATCVFVDETWATTAMTRTRGRCPSGERLVAAVPHGHWKTTTLVAALGHAGVRCAMTLDGPVDRAAFEAFVGRVLAPTLRPGDVVVMDNLSSHKGPRVREMVEAAGAALAYLPPYSPDLNPIELAFAKLKQLMRSAAHRAADALRDDVQRMLDLVTPGDAANFVRHCGYVGQAATPGVGKL